MTLPGLRLATLASLLLLLPLPQPVLSKIISLVPYTDTNILCYEIACNATTIRDLSCICSDAGYNSVFSCINENATGIVNFYTSLRLLDRDCDIPRRIDTIDPNYLATAIGTFAVQTLFFALRIVSRMIGVGEWGWDDHTCVLAYITLVGQFIMQILLDHYRFYENYWTLDTWKDGYWLRINFARAETYAVGLGLCKMSILFFYQRVFEGPRLKRVLIVTQVVNVLLALSYFITSFFVSIPFDCQFQVDIVEGCSYHDIWDGSGSYSALNAALDVWMVIIPAVVVWKLQMKTMRKISVIAMFSTGISTCLVAIMRFAIYRIHWDEVNDTVYYHIVWVNYAAYYIELTTCFVIACLPASRQLVGQKFWPGLKNGMRVFSISTWTRSMKKSKYSSKQDPAGTKHRSFVVSSPIDGSFQHLTSHLQSEEPKGKHTSPSL